ncbi:ABC transporter ATP-binding protein [Herbidospora sp. RD11066]
MSRLELRGLTKRFGPVTALDDVGLIVSSGTLLAVLGPSGCGKTTLLRCVAGFERPDAGEIMVDDHPIPAAIPPERRKIVVVPQEGALFPHLPVRENVEYGLTRSERRSGRALEVLELVGLAGYGDRMPHHLSGGQRQRVAVARALAPRPSLILLDEPFSALDATLRTEMREEIRAALHDDGATGILVTHDQGEALSMADEVAVMRDGRVVQCAPPAVVYREPADTWVAGFVGEAVFVPMGPEVAMIRPEQIRITFGGVEAEVLGHTFHGHDATVRLRLADGGEVVARVPGHLVPATGGRVGVVIDGPLRTYPGRVQEGPPGILAGSQIIDMA